MFSIFNTLFGRPPEEPLPPRAETSPGGDGPINRYFALSTEIEQGKADRDYGRAIRAARATYVLFPSVVAAWMREYRRFDINTSHAVHTAPALMAVLEDREGLRELRQVLEAVPELRDWLPAADEAEADLTLVTRIMALVHAEPGIVQATLKTRLGEALGHGHGTLAGWLEKAGRLARVKKGASYLLYPAGAAMASAAPVRPPETVATPAPVTSSAGPPLRRRVRRSAMKAQVLDLANLPVVRLPKAPPAWADPETASQGPEAAWDLPGAPAAAPEGRPRQARKRAAPRFVVEGEGWALAAEEKLAAADRPDPAYKESFPTGRFTHSLDPNGKRDGFELAASVLRVTDREGHVVAERGLAHDVYRADVNADGTGILFLSREGILHGYTESVEPLIAEALPELPEYQAQAARLGIEARELKNHTRCVAISADRSRYLVTVVDEAWCLNTASGEVLWSLRMPTQEGWTRVVAERSTRTGTSAEIDAALRLMELTLPVTPEAITQRYRALAMGWHPDKNPGDPTATARFQSLGAAMELLTGTDLSALSSQEAERVTYRQVLSTARFSAGRGGGTVEVSIVIGGGEKAVADWIYAANLGRDGRAFLAGYSGKLVVVSPSGYPERVYDVGAVPRHVVDAGERLYVVTDTRLYVVAGDALEALVDVRGAGTVVVADRGFALLEPKAVTWFTPTGRHIGAVRTKDPLRRARSTPEGLVVETRQHRARVTGAPAWWG